MRFWLFAVPLMVVLSTSSTRADINEELGKLLEKYRQTSFGYTVKAQQTMAAHREYPQVLEFAVDPCNVQISPERGIVAAGIDLSDAAIIKADGSPSEGINRAVTLLKAEDTVPGNSMEGFVIKKRLTVEIDTTPPNVAVGSPTLVSNPLTMVTAVVVPNPNFFLGFIPHWSSSSVIKWDITIRLFKEYVDVIGYTWNLSVTKTSKERKGSSESYLCRGLREKPYKLNNRTTIKLE